MGRCVHTGLLHVLSLLQEWHRCVLYSVIAYFSSVYLGSGQHAQKLRYSCIIVHTSTHT